MGMKVLTCPQCSANIEIDESKEFGVCSYCGAKFQLHDVVEIRHTGKVELDTPTSYEKMLEKGRTFIKLEKWEEAKAVFNTMLKEHPAKKMVYYYYVYASSRGFTENGEPAFGKLKDYQEKTESLGKLLGENSMNQYEWICQYIDCVAQELAETRRKDKLTKWLGGFAKIALLVGFAVAFALGLKSMDYVSLAVGGVGLVAVICVGAVMRGRKKRIDGEEYTG